MDSDERKPEPSARATSAVTPGPGMAAAMPRAAL